MTKRYESSDQVVALDSVDLDISRGERVALMGPSGSGKSTLLNLISGLDEPTSGSIYFEDRALDTMTDNELTLLRRKKIGLIFQTFNLLPTLSAIENVSLPLRLDGKRRRNADKRSTELLERVGLSERLTHRPDELSGGERQRIAIARALVFEPVVLLADEPTGNLDSHTGAEIIALLDNLHDEFGTTIVLVTHNDAAAEHCERKISMLDGRIVSGNGSLNSWQLILLVFIQVIWVTMVYGPIAAYLVEAFPAKIRYTALSLPYHIGNGVFGGLLPLIGLTVIAQTGNIYAGLYYPILIAGITFVVGSIFLRETRGRKIWAEVDDVSVARTQ